MRAHFEQAGDRRKSYSLLTLRLQNAHKSKIEHLGSDGPISEENSRFYHVYKTGVSVILYKASEDSPFFTFVGKDNAVSRTRTIIERLLNINLEEKR